MTFVPVEITPQWQPYLDVAQDVKPYLQIPATTTTYDATLQLLVDSECTWVQNYLGRPVAPTTYFRRFSGWSGMSGAYVSLPYYPVLSIGAVVEWWGTSGQRTDTSCGTTSLSATVTDPAITAADVGSHVNGPNVPGDATILTVNPGVSFTMTLNATATGLVSLVIAQGHVLREQWPANQGNQDMFQCDYLRGTLIRTFQGLVQRPWFPGSRNIEVTWTAGYNPAPADIRRATLLLIKERWNEEQQASRSTARPAGSSDYMTPDSPYFGVESEVKRYLQPYTQVGIG